MSDIINIYTKVLFVVIAHLLIFCKGKEKLHTALDTISAKNQNYGKSSSPFYQQERTDTVRITEGEHTFFVPTMKDKIRSFDCTECHTEPVNQMKGSGKKKAHWGIKLAHAQQDVMNCMTCHSAKNMNNLHTLTGKSVDINFSHKVCAQCHTTQFEDWKGGAHGKKLSGWTPPRMSMTCVNCHDSHDPAFEKRWPARFNTN